MTNNPYNAPEREHEHEHEHEHGPPNTLLQPRWWIAGAVVTMILLCGVWTYRVAEERAERDRQLRTSVTRPIQHEHVEQDE